MSKTVNNSQGCFPYPCWLTLVGSGLAHAPAAFDSEAAKVEGLCRMAVDPRAVYDFPLLSKDHEVESSFISHMKLIRHVVDQHISLSRNVYGDP